MLQNLTFNVLAILAMLFVVAHVGLVVMSRWLNPIALLAAAYFVLSPLSAATDLSYLVVFKYGRVYVTLLLLFVAFFIVRLYRLRATAVVFLLFVGFYVLAALWSALPVAALKYKGLYGLAVLSGFMLAYSIRDFRDLEMSMRLLLVAATIFAGLILIEFLQNPAALIRNDRLAFWNMNPNRVGQSLAAMLILVAYMALYDRSILWRRTAYIVGSVLGIMMIFTGSRAAAGEALIGCFIVAIPMFRQPGRLAVVGILVVITIMIVLKTTEVAGPERLLDTSLDNRQGVWTNAISLWKESPLYGQGWVYNTVGDRAATANMHSIYLQTIVEAGIFGAVLMALAMFYVVYAGRRLHRYVRELDIVVPAAYLALGYVVAIFVHGTVEAGTFQGSTLNAMMLPFALGLFDRIPEMLRGEGVLGEPIETFDDAEEYAEYGETDLDPYEDETAVGAGAAGRRLRH